MQPPDFTFRINEPVIALHQQIASCACYAYGCVGSIQTTWPREGETEGFVFDASFKPLCVRLDDMSRWCSIDRDRDGAALIDKDRQLLLNACRMRSSVSPSGMSCRFTPAFRGLPIDNAPAVSRPI